MKNKSVIYCYVLGGLLMIGGAIATTTFIEDHSVRLFNWIAEKWRIILFFFLVKNLCIGNDGEKEKQLIQKREKKAVYSFASII